MNMNRIFFVVAASLLFASVNLHAAATPLTITCPTNMAAAATGSGGATVFFTVTASGGCSLPSVSANPPSGSTFPIGTTTVSATAYDTCHNTNNCSFTVTITNAPIVLNCPSNITVAASNGMGVTVFFTATASGGCSPPPYVVASPPSGSTFPVGTTLVSVTASDHCGSSTNGTFTVTVTSAPIAINCSSNLTVSAPGPGGATVFYNVTANGGCSPPPYVVANPPSGSTFAVGMTTVTAIASDTCGNSNTCSFTVTVNPPTNSITINCSSNLTVSATGPGGATVFFTATASGGCSLPYVNATPPSGSTFPIGTNTVTVTANDYCANSANCSFTVTVMPLSQPLQTNSFPNASAQILLQFPDYHTETITLKGQLTMASAVGPAGQASDTDGSGLDEVGTEMAALNLSGNCSIGPVTITLNPSQLSLGQIQENQNNTPGVLDVPPFTPTGTATSFFDIFTEISVNGGPTLFPSSPPYVSGMITNFPSGSGEELFGYQYIPLEDAVSNYTGYYLNSMLLIPSPLSNSPIVINCSSNLAVTASGPGGATVFFTVTASGGCAPPPTLAVNPPSGSTFAVGTTPITAVAGDSCGNSNTCSFTVTVYPTTNTITINCPTNITVMAAGPSGAVVYYNVTASGGCSPPPYVYTYPPSGSTFAVGTTTVNSTASDTCGNSANCSFTVTVVPSANPQADLQVTKTVSPTNTTAGQQVIFTIALENLGPNNVTNEIVVTDCLPPGFEYVTDSTYGGGGIGTYSPGTCWWTLTGLGVNATVYLNITAVTTNIGVFTNTATVAVPQGYTDPNLGNNSASAVVAVKQTAADLQVTKTVSTNSAKLFQQFNFLVTITNVGPVAVSNVFVSELLPAGLAEVYWVGYGGINQNYNPTNGVWSITNIPPGLGYSLSIGAAGASVGTFTNIAQLAASTPADTNAANNTAVAVVTITPLQADLAVTKTVSPGVMNTNGQVQFTITIQNNGPDTASNIVVQDNLPAGLSLVSSNVPSGTVFNAGTGAWSIPFLTNGATAALGLRVTSPNAGNFTNVAFVASSASADPNLLNNTNSAMVIFVAGQAADLAVSLVPTTNIVPVGGTILFACAVTNLGPNAPTNVTAKLTYPPGMVISGVFGPFGSGAFDTNTGILTVFGTLLPGTLENVNIQFTVTNAGVFTLTFQTTSSSLPDPILSNNSTSVTVTGLVSYAISGGIRSCSATALTNIPVILSSANMSNLSTNTGTNGGFSFSSLLPGSYTVTPASSNYFYLPTNMVVTIVNTNVTLTNFIALPRFITGTVCQGSANGQPVSGVTVLLGGALSLTNTTGTNGVYSFTNLNAGTYTITPQTNGFLGIRFAPTNAVVALGSPTNCPGAADFVTTNIIVVLRALEVIQVVQDWSNSVVLVANKATLVRAHLQLYGTNTTPILVEGARLYAQNLGGGSDNWAPDNGRITVKTNNCAAPVIRSNITMSLNFTVRDGFKTGSDIFRFSWTNGIVFNAEPADVAGDPGSNGQVRVSFNVVPPLGVRFIRVAITNAVTNITALATNITIVTNLPTPAQIEEEKRRIISIYPMVSLADLTSGYYLWSRANGAPTNESRLLQGINAARLTSSDTNGAATNRIWYVVLPQGVDVRGLGYLPGYAAIGCISSSPQDYQRHLAAHEIGHAMGRPHSIDVSFGRGDCKAGQVSGHCEECAAGGSANFPMVDTPAFGLMPTLGPLADDNQVIWGYDHYQAMVISPYYYYDLMSYCYGTTKGFAANALGPWPWNSKFTYTNLYTVNQTRFAAAAPHSLPQGLPTPDKRAASQFSQPYLLVRGQIDDYSGDVTFQPCYPVSSALPVTSGPFTLVVLDTNAVPLYSIPFAPDVLEGEFDDQPDITTFDLSVPIIAGAAAIEIYSNAIPVGELVADAYPPSVQVLHPNGGEKFGDTDIPVNWTASDPDGSPLVYLVQFSPDGGNSWDTLMLDWDQTNLDIPPDTLPATTNGLIRVTASDGFNTYTAQSAGPFTITNHVPAISILQPGSGALFYGDQTIVLEADAYDLEDGSLDGTNVLWTSSLDGPLGSGSTLPLETLNLHEGIHLVTATAIANSGLTNSASVQITVLRLAPPQLSIQLTNNNQILVSWPVVYTNYLLESATSLLPSSWAAVTNVPAGADPLQTVNLNLSTTNRFFRLRLP